MPEVDPTSARQGRKGSRVLIILIAALVLVLIAAFGMGIFGASEPEENIGGAEQSGASTEGIAPADSGDSGETVVPPQSQPAQ